MPVHAADPVTATPLPYSREGAPTILLVEDSLTQRRLVHRLLEACGNWAITYASDGVEALERIERSAPDVVLTDVFMPRMDGLALVEQIRERFPQVPVVLMTGQGSEQMAVDALKAGAADYVPKSNLATTAGAVLERVLAAARAETDKHRLLSGLTGRVTRLVLDNDASLVPPLVAQLRDDLLATGVCDRNEVTRVGIALEEALLNAVYHGNLEVSSDLKANGDGPFLALAAERRGLEPYRSRRVRVSARMTTTRAVFVIADQGPGFDVTKLPDPTDPEYLDRPCGRGLLLMRAFMDDVRYNPTGNRVTLVKTRGSVPQE